MPTDIRKWRFTAGYGTTSLASNEATDFWGEWIPEGEPAFLNYHIHGQYDLGELVAPGLDAYEVRIALERRLKTIAKYQGRQGILDIDWDQGGTRPESMDNMVLDSISVVQGDTQLILEVDLKFKAVSPGTLLRSISLLKVNPPLATPPAWSATTQYKAGDRVLYGTVTYLAIFSNVNSNPSTNPVNWGIELNPNKGNWDATVLYAANDIVAYGGVIWKAKQPNRGQIPAINAIWGVNGVAVSALDNCWFTKESVIPDGTLFKQVARGAQIRVPANQALQMETLTLTGIRQKVVIAGGVLDNAQELARRQKSETLMRSFELLKGFEFVLTIDGASEGTVHLSDVTKGSIDLPDAVTFDLVFFKGYVNG